MDILIISQSQDSQIVLHCHTLSLGWRLSILEVQGVLIVSIIIIVIANMQTS